MNAGRLAPSPTGALHLGNARTFLAAWVSARAQGLRVLLRIEDIDGPRVKPGAAEQAIEDLRWLGLDWDGEPLHQSTRIALYAAALARLRAADRVYPCTCSRADIQRAASAPHADSEGPTYPGTCAGRTATTVVNRPHAWRFRVTQSPGFVDGIRGSTVIDLRTHGGDFVVWKTTNEPAYQLAVVVDDAAQGIVEVVRGDDLLSSTPRQLLLYEALELTPPRFVHLPLMLDADGKRMAKRHDATSLRWLRENRLDPRTVVGWLGWTLGWLPEPRPVDPRELIGRFDWASVPRQTVDWTEEHGRFIGLPGDPQG